MGIGWLKGVLDTKPSVLSCEYYGKNLLKITVRTTGISSQKDYIIYMPEIKEYVVTQDIVDKAAGLGANLIVCDSWARPTGDAIAYGKSKGIGVYKGGYFLSKIDNGETL